MSRTEYREQELNCMKDLMIRLDDRPGALAEMGEALGSTGVNIEGGGAFTVDGRGIAHFLVDDSETARRALAAVGITAVEERTVLVQRLRQGEPGQLGRLTRRMAEAGVNIEVIYSDHENQLILVVDDLEKGRAVSDEWMRETGDRPAARSTAGVPDSTAADTPAC